MIRLRELAGVAGIVLSTAYVATRLLPVGTSPAAAPIAEAAMQAHSSATIAMERFAVDAPLRAKPLFVAARVERSDEVLNSDIVAEAPRPPEEARPDPELAGLQADAVARHLASRVPAHLVPYFDIFVYVSKAKSGAWAQNMYLFRKSRSGSLVFEESFEVSTGRERAEKYFTTTPAGIFTLDPKRLVRTARSGKWNNAPMPHAMFLDYSYRTQMSGVALHAAVGRNAIGDLGNRASGGCVRLPPDKAALLFDRVKNGPRTMVPVFAFDHVRGTTNIEGRVKKDSEGRIILKEGLPVLLLIDDVGGPATILSSL